MSWLKKLLGRRQESDQQIHTSENSSKAEKSSSEPLAIFHPLNEFERSLMDAATNPDARPAFQKAMLEATLYAATPDAPDVASVRTVDEGENIRLLNVTGPEGQSAAAIFTAQERIAEVFGSGTGFIALKGEDLLSMVASQGAALNPGLPYGVHWTSEQLFAILGQPMPYTIEKETQLLLGTPAEPPVTLINDLRTALARDSRINE